MTIYEMYLNDCFNGRLGDRVEVESYMLNKSVPEHFNGSRKNEQEDGSFELKTFMEYCGGNVISLINGKLGIPIGYRNINGGRKKPLEKKELIDFIGYFGLASIISKENLSLHIKKTDEEGNIIMSEIKNSFINITELPICGERRNVEIGNPVCNVSKAVAITLKNEDISKIHNGETINEGLKTLQNEAMSTGALAHTVSGEDMKDKTVMIVKSELLTEEIFTNIMMLKDYLHIDWLDRHGLYAEYELGEVPNGAKKFNKDYTKCLLNLYGLSWNQIKQISEIKKLYINNIYPSEYNEKYTESEILSMTKDQLYTLIEQIESVLAINLPVTSSSLKAEMQNALIGFLTQ